MYRKWKVVLVVLLTLACVTCEPSKGVSTGDSGTDADTDSDADSDGDTDTDTDFEECAGISESAENQILPVDIIFLVDTSASMMEEALGVRNNLNVFSQQIIAAGIDVRIVMIGETGGFFGNPMI